MKTVLFLGAGRHQRAAILQAKELGLRVAAIDGNPNALALGDAARAVVLLLDRPGAWDIGRDDEPRSLEEVARLACRLSGAPESLIELVDPPVGPAPVLEELDVEPLRALGWQPTVELDDGMRRTLDWLSSPAA